MEAETMSVEEAHKTIALYEKFKNTVDKKAKRSTPELKDVRAAVAAVVLAELETWPEEVQSLIGGQHPSKESFIKGVPYIIGAYMHIAEKGLKDKVRDQLREAELKTVKKLSSLAKEISSLKEEHRHRCTTSTHALAAERDKKLRESKKIIQREYESKIAKARNLKLPKILEDLESREKDIKKVFETYEGLIEVDAIKLSDLIKAVAETKNGWDSKSRREERCKRQAEKVSSGHRKRTTSRK